MDTVVKWIGAVLFVVALIAAGVVIGYLLWPIVSATALIHLLIRDVHDDDRLDHLTAMAVGGIAVAGVISQVAYAAYLILRFLQ